MQPLVGPLHVLGIHGEARREHEARGLGRLAQPFERGPRPLGIHVIDRERRHATPVVDAGREQRREIVAEVRGRLQVHVGRQDHARGRDRPQELVGRARIGAVHRRTGLGQEVLHDHLLHVPVLEVRVRDRDERVDALGARLADPDEDARRERHPGPARRVQRREPALRRLVGRAEVRATRLAEPRRERLDHHPLRRAHRAQLRELGLARARPRWRGGAGRSRRAPASRPRRGSRPSTRSRSRASHSAACG